MAKYAKKKFWTLDPHPPIKGIFLEKALLFKLNLPLHYKVSLHSSVVPNPSSVGFKVLQTNPVVPVNQISKVIVKMP